MLSKAILKKIAAKLIQLSQTFKEVVEIKLKLVKLIIINHRSFNTFYNHLKTSKKII